VHQVFISYAEKDEDAASRVCEMLEAEGTGCWLRVRDAAAGEDAAEAAMDALRTSDLVLLVFSASANDSPAVLGEIERAVAWERPVVPVRIDDSVPNSTLQHYLDVGAPPSATGIPETLQESEGDSPVAAAKKRRLSRRTWGIAVGAALVALALGLGLGLGLTGHSSAWAALDPSGTEPSPRACAAVAYDEVTHRLIVFSGGDDVGDFSDTWAYDSATNTWTDLKPSGTLPIPRMYAGMAYDPVTRRLIMFGGLDRKTNTCLSDTWAYDPAVNSWTKLDPRGPTPPARAWNVLVRDPDSGKLVMFGGMAGGEVADLVAGDQLNDTWAYDPAANIWTGLKPAGAFPPARYAYTMVYDPSSKQMILFGGITGTTRFNDTWAYDPAVDVWRELKPASAIPKPRGAQSMAYDPATRRVIMFGGAVSLTTLFNETWAYDPVRNAWVELNPVGTPPPPRGGHAMVADPTSGRLIVFGGLDDTAAFRSDLWALTP
jgi:N-acetylneuraminic acid mutarotase